jgi:hypothetical protein
MRRGEGKMALKTTIHMLKKGPWSRAADPQLADLSPVAAFRVCV